MEKLFARKVTPKGFYTFVLPSIVMMVVLSLYYTLDTMLVSNYLGKDSLAIMSLTYPLIGLIWGVAIMFSAGSSAIVAMLLGESRHQEANEKFTLISLVAFLISLIFSLIAFVGLDPLILFLGATDALYPLAKDFMGILIWSCPAAFLGVIFEYYIRVDGRPGLTLVLYLISGLLHVFTTWFMLHVFHWGIEASALGNFVGVAFTALLGFIYFLFPKTGLSFALPKWDPKFIWHSITNGSSEFVTESSDGIATYLFNLLMLRMVGEMGISALSIVFSIHYFFLSIHLGFIIGIAPLISFYYGKKNYVKVNIFLRYSKIFILVTAVLLTALCFFGAENIVSLFHVKDPQLYDLAVRGMRLVSPSFLFVGLTIFASGFFTAYGNGHISAIISLLRALIFIVAFAFLLSHLFGSDGLWLAPLAAEAVTALLSILLIKKYKEKYHYSF